MSLQKDVQLICEKLEQLATKIAESSTQDATFTQQFGWNAPGLTRHDLAQSAQNIATRIRESCDDLALDEDIQTAIFGIDKQIQFTLDQTVPQLWNGGNSPNAVIAVLGTLFGIEQVFSSTFSAKWIHHENLNLAPRDLSRRIRGIEGQLNKTEPELAELLSSLQLIREARTTANELPADLEMLRQSRKEIDRIQLEAKSGAKDVATKCDSSERALSTIETRLSEAEKLISAIRELHRVGTSTTLAGAFQARADALTRSGWWWLAILVAALTSGVIIGGIRVNAVSDIIRTSTTVNWQAVWVNIALVVLGVSAPIWLAWMATKQIVQTFRLSEDYAYKASISNAYEGYRREAVNTDKHFQDKLFDSALTRLDELPGRLVDSKFHGSPLHELLESEVITRALNVVPGVANQFKEVAQSALDFATRRSTNPMKKSSEKDLRETAPLGGEQA